jgi:sporulation protein YlmC with PRC-barrel domain
MLTHNYYLTPQGQAQQPGARQQQDQPQQSTQGQPRGSSERSNGGQQAQGQQRAGGAASDSEQQGGQAGHPGGQAGEPHLLIGRGVVTTLFPPLYASATEELGTEVQSADGQFVGEIDRLMLDTDHGHVAYVLVAQGGILGTTGEWIPVPFEALQSSPQAYYRLNIDEHQLQEARALPMRELPAHVRAQQLQKLYERYGVTPYWEQG